MTPHIRHTLLVASGQAAVKLTQLVIAIVLVRLLSPLEWSEVAYLLSIYLAAIAIGTLNLQHGIIFYTPRVPPRRQRALVMQNMGVLVLIGAAIATGLVIAAPLIVGGRLGTTDRIVVLGIAIALELPVACTATALIAHRRFGRAALWDLAGTGLIVAGTVVPVLAGHGVDGVVVGLALAGATRLALSFVVIGRLLPGPWSGLSMGVLGEQVRYALPLGAALGVSMLNRLVDKWLIAAFDPGNFGIYAVAAQEVPLLSVLPYAGGAALVSALVDAFRDGDIAVARTHWLHLTMTMSNVVVPMSFLLILVAPDVLPAMFTAEFVSGVVPFQVFTLVTVHRVAEYGLMLRAAGRNRDLLAVAAITLIANALLAGFGAWAAGMIGASIGTLVASGIGWYVALRAIADALQTNINGAFAWRAWCGTLAIAAMSALIVGIVFDTVDVAPAPSVIGKTLVFVALFAVGLRRWRRSRHSAAPEAVSVPAVPARVPVATP